MIFHLETGYFIWNFLGWAGIFLFSALLFCFFIYINVNKNCIIRVKGDEGTFIEFNGSGSGFENKVFLFRTKCLAPWFEKHFCHILTVAVLFLLFLTALFSSFGVE